MSRLDHCARCGWYIHRDSASEAVHAKRCNPKSVTWRGSGALDGTPGPSKVDLRTRLRATLATSALAPIVIQARLGIHPDQLRRVAEGRSDFAPSTWRRLLPYFREPGDQ